MVLYICHPLDKVGGMDDKVGKSGKKWSILTKGPRRPDMLFRGQSYRSLDAKGRLMLPPEFRDALTAASADGTFVLTTYDGCLVGYPGPLWNELIRPGSRLCSHRILTMWPMNWLKAASTSLFKNPRTRCL